MRKTDRGLTPRQARFVDEMLVDDNGTQAAIRAGYKRHSAYIVASKLLRNPKVAAAVAAGRAKRSESTGITSDRVLVELGLLAFSDVTHYLFDDQGRVHLAPGAPAGAQRAISSLKVRITTTGDGDKRSVTRDVEFRLHDKVSTLKLAGRHVGLFPNHVDDPKVVQQAERMLRAAVDRARGNLEATADPPALPATVTP